MTKKLVLALVLLTSLAGCGVNSVTPEEIAAVKKGDVLIWRYAKKTDGDKGWFYGERIDSVEGDSVTFTPSSKEGNTKNISSIREWSDEQDTTTLTELKKYATEQGVEKKVIIQIESPSS